MFNQCLLQNDNPWRSVFCFIPPSLDTHRFQTFSTEFIHLNFVLPAPLLPTGFPRNAFFAVLSSAILTTWPTHSSFLTFIVVTIFGFLYVTCNSSFSILQAFWSLIRPCDFLNIARSHISKNYYHLLCPCPYFTTTYYITVCLIIVEYILSSVKESDNWVELNGGEVCWKSSKSVEKRRLVKWKFI